MLICAILLISINTIHTAEYIGCNDGYTVQQPDSDGLLFLHDQLMSTEYCEKQCSERNYSYMLLHNHFECWCSNTYDIYGSASNNKLCNTTCSGNIQQICGGTRYYSIYSITPSGIPYSRWSMNSSTRPLLGLLMIVKDESHTLSHTLQSLIPYIDIYFILDTGSTDGTQQVVASTLSRIPGEIHESEFIDYGTSRNNILQIAQDGGTMKYSPIFSLMLSADETVYNVADLYEFCVQHQHNTGALHHAYSIQLDAGWRFDALRLSRTDDGWRYVGAVHEALMSPDNDILSSPIRIPNVYIKFIVTDSERRDKREQRIRSILEREKVNNINDTRTSFYLARTYSNLHMYNESLHEFRHRVSLGGWREEIYESLYAIGWVQLQLNYSWSIIHNSWLRAYQYSPERAEPLYAISQHLYNQLQYPLAHMYSCRCIELSYPHTARLWVQSDVYKWQCHWIIAMSGLHIGDITTPYIHKSAVSAVITQYYQPNDHIITQQIQQYKSRLNQQQWEQVELTAQSYINNKLGISHDKIKPTHLSADMMTDTDIKNEDNNNSIVHPLDMLDDIKLQHSVKHAINNDTTSIDTSTLICIVLILGSLLLYAIKSVTNNNKLVIRNRRILDKII